MTDAAMIPAIKAAIQANEIGTKDPYTLSFAATDESGPSFGVYQNDTHKNPAALQTLRDIVSAVPLPDDQIDRIAGLLSQQCDSNPLNSDDAAAVDSALHSDQGKAKVDALDQGQLTIVCGYLDKAIAAAASPVSGEAQLCICMWCNMTGAPTVLLQWIAGSGVDEAGGHVAPPGNPVSLDDMTRFLQKTKFFTKHPGNWEHFLQSEQTGAGVLPQAEPVDAV